MFSYPTVHTQQSTAPPGVAEHNVTVARAFTKLMGAARATCAQLHHGLPDRARAQDAPTRSDDLAWFALDGTMTDVFSLAAVTLSGTGVSVLD